MHILYIKVAKEQMDEDKGGENFLGLMISVTCFMFKTHNMENQLVYIYPLPKLEISKYIGNQQRL